MTRNRWRRMLSVVLASIVLVPGAVLIGPTAANASSGCTAANPIASNLCISVDTTSSGTTVTYIHGSLQGIAGIGYCSATRFKLTATRANGQPYATEQNGNCVDDLWTGSESNVSWRPAGGIAFKRDTKVCVRTGLRSSNGTVQWFNDRLACIWIE